MQTKRALQSLSDSELIVRSLRRPDDFVVIFDRHAASLHAYLSRRAGSQGAEDLMGEVWLQAFRSRGSYDSKWPDARGWLCGIARNTLKRHWRLRGPTNVASADAATDPWPDVDRQLDAAARAADLRAALSALPGDDREVLLLFAWEELSPSEIAIVLDVPAGTVRWRLHRARAALKESAPDSTSSVRVPIAEEA